MLDNPLESGTADSRLRELYRRTNSLPHLPEEIGSMAELRQIDLRGTPLAALPETLIELPRLEKLDLRWVTWDFLYPKSIVRTTCASKLRLLCARRLLTGEIGLLRLMHLVRSDSGLRWVTAGGRASRDNARSAPDSRPTGLASGYSPLAPIADVQPGSTPAFVELLKTIFAT